MEDFSPKDEPLQSTLRKSALWEVLVFFFLHFWQGGDDDKG